MINFTSGLVFLPFGVSWFLAQAGTTQARPSGDAAQTFYNLATLIIGTLAAIAVPYLNRYFVKMKEKVKEEVAEEVEQAKKNLPSKNLVESHQQEIVFLHERMDKMIDTVDKAKREKEEANKQRDEANLALSEASKEFTRLTRELTESLDRERKTTSGLIESLDDNQKQTDNLERKVNGMLAQNELAVMIVDRMEAAYVNKIIPEITKTMEPFVTLTERLSKIDFERLEVRKE